MPFGDSFFPPDVTTATGAPRSQPVQEVIRILSLRLPRAVSGSVPSAPMLLQTAGSRAAPFLAQSAMGQTLAQLARRPEFDQTLATQRVILPRSLDRVSAQQDAMPPRATTVNLELPRQRARFGNTLAEWDGRQWMAVGPAGVPFQPSNLTNPTARALAQAASVPPPPHLMFR